MNGDDLSSGLAGKPSHSASIKLTSLGIKSLDIHLHFSLSLANNLQKSLDSEC
jgi:hypothetical protein